MRTSSLQAKAVHLSSVKSLNCTAMRGICRPKCCFLAFLVWQHQL